MFRNLDVHPGNKRLGKPGDCFFFFLELQYETGTFEAARGQRKPHRSPPPTLLFCSVLCLSTHRDEAVLNRGSSFHTPRSGSSSLPLRLKKKVGKGLGQRTVAPTQLCPGSHPMTPLQSQHRLKRWEIHGCKGSSLASWVIKKHRKQ